MVNQYDLSKIDRYSLEALFYFYKNIKEDILLSEIYRRTHDCLFQFVFPKVSSSSEAALIIQEVYRVTKKSLSRLEREQCIYAYLTRLADGCLITHSSKLLKA